jgi:FKBP-type peptidyl-prolyl cis-trans isomerase SlyD
MDKVDKEAMVTIEYVMRSRLPEGAAKERPQETIEFVYGVDRQVSSLETALQGARVGDTFEVEIPPAEVFGEHDPDLVKEIPKKGLIKQRLKQGQFYRQMKKGSLVSFKVLEVGPDSVVADFNKPMAGIVVSMDVEVLAIRKANQKEIEMAQRRQFQKTIGCG